MWKINILLTNGYYGVLDSKAVRVPDGEDEAPIIKAAVLEMVQDDVLAVGDVIKIVEVIR